MSSAAFAPTRWACCVRRMASRVLFEPVPAITGMRPRASCTVTWIIRPCSSWESVADSPVVPHGTSALVPASTCPSIKRASARSSMASRRNGVTSATIEPPQLMRISFRSIRTFPGRAGAPLLQDRLR